VKRVRLTRGHVALVDDEDFPLVAPHKWQLYSAKGRRTKYAITTVAKRTIYMHRLILGVGPEVRVDHGRHQDGAAVVDNRRANLRVASQRDNTRNARKALTRAASRYKGVSLSLTRRGTRRWRARITLAAGTLHLGYFTSERRAAEAYNAAAQRHFGEFAVLNH
jgi:hypothetical protein